MIPRLELKLNKRKCLELILFIMSYTHKHYSPELSNACWLLELYYLFFRFFKNFDSA